VGYGSEGSFDKYMSSISGGGKASAAVDKTFGLGKGGGGMEPLTMIGAQILGSVVGGLFDMYQGQQNRAQQERFHQEAMDMAKKEYEWGQTVDRFNMDMTVKEALAKANEEQRTQLMSMLKTRFALKDRANNLFSGKGGAI